MQTNNS
jgi:t-SNARE complex subunit (syntaxin)